MKSYREPVGLAKASDIYAKAVKLTDNENTRLVRFFRLNAGLLPDKTSS